MLQTVEFLQSSTQKPEQVPDYQTVPILPLVPMGKHSVTAPILGLHS